MTTSHTPGPWTYSLSEEGEELSINANGGQTGVLGGCGCCGSPWCSAADARLIAAAPDLLEALTRAKRHLLVASQEWEAADAAISKATGATP